MGCYSLACLEAGTPELQPTTRGCRREFPSPTFAPFQQLSGSRSQGSLILDQMWHGLVQRKPCSRGGLPVTATETSLRPPCRCRPHHRAYVRPAFDDDEVFYVSFRFQISLNTVRLFDGTSFTSFMHEINSHYKPCSLSHRVCIFSAEPLPRGRQSIQFHRSVAFSGRPTGVMPSSRRCVCDIPRAARYHRLTWGSARCALITSTSLPEYLIQCCNDDQWIQPHAYLLPRMPCASLSEVRTALAHLNMPERHIRVKPSR